MQKLRLNCFIILIPALGLSGCASQPENVTENRVKDEQCYATGSNLPRRDCSEVLKVDPSTMDRAAQPAARGSGSGAK